MKKDFEKFITTLKEDFFSWDYFVDFEKVKRNTFEIKVHLNILNSLIGEKDIENKFINLLKKYPEVRSSLPILISTRIKKLKEIKIINTGTLISNFTCDLFNSEKGINESEMIHFFTATGLKDIFENSYISNLNDYVFGVETGLDSHARKNRSGDLMEIVVNDILKNFVKNNTNFIFTDQANSKKIKDILNYDVQKNENDRISDFALLDIYKNKLYLIEVNLYGSGGTKLKAVAGEFEKVNNFILNQNIEFVWVSDGIGWKTAENPMKEAFQNNKYTFNLNQFKEFLLEIST